MLKKYSSRCFIFFFSMALLTACQMPPKVKTSTATQTAQPSIKIKTRASSYVYLTPIPEEERTVYISIKNDSGTDAFDLQPWLVQSLQEKSFTVVDNVDKANLVVRATLLRVGKINDEDVEATLASEFGNSAQLLSLEPEANSTQPLPNNDAIILDLQYFDRENLVDPAQVKPRSTMANLTDLQLLLLCNTSHWERYQTRIVSIIFDNHASQKEKFAILGQSIATANADIVRGLA